MYDNEREWRGLTTIATEQRLFLEFFSWEIGAASPEESQLRQSRAIQPELITNLVCAVFLCDNTTGSEAYSFTTDGYGTFNVRTNVDAYRTHEGGEGSGTNKSAQRVDSEGPKKTTKLLTMPAQAGARTQGLRI